jgi:hypothetical protein
MRSFGVRICSGAGEDTGNSGAVPFQTNNGPPVFNLEFARLSQASALIEV